MTAAAERLNLTQPAVSQQIRSLEDEMKVALLVRGVRQVKPTMQGQLLYDYAKRILYLTQQAEVAIQTMSQEISGDLRVGTINSIGLYMISPVVGMFLKHNINLRIKLVYGSYEETVRAMQEGDIDLAILPDVETELGVKLPDFDSRFLLKDRMVLVGSGRDSSLPVNIAVSDFNLKPVIIYSEMYPGFERLLSEKLKQKNMSLKPVFEADNVGTLKRVIESGVGWGFLPEHSIRKQIRSGRMTHIHVDDLSYEATVKLYFRRGEQHQRMADVFFRAIK